MGTVSNINEVQMKSIVEDAERMAELKKEEEPDFDFEPKTTESREESINRIARPPPHMKSQQQHKYMLQQQPSTSRGTRLVHVELGKPPVRVTLAKCPIANIRSKHPPLMRPRGELQSTLPRYIRHDDHAFNKCDMCNHELAGCITGPFRAPALPDATILTCGHVVCPDCRHQSMATEKAPAAKERVLYKCLFCKTAVSAILLPSKNNVNLSSCQAPYCTGEAFALPQSRCTNCKQRLCLDCIKEHARRHRDHKVESANLFKTNRPFTVCPRHKAPVVAKCTCGEMVCDSCEDDFHTKKGECPVDHHTKIPLQTVDIELENHMIEIAKPLRKLNDMKRKAELRRQNIMNIVDKTNNEIALHFNQIILQAIQRCFDVMNAVKQTAAQDYCLIRDFITELNTAERKISRGTLIDERARSYESVPAESVANYAKHVGYTLCEEPIAVMKDLQARSRVFDNSLAEITLPNIDTASIIESIGMWGEKIRSNFGSTIQNCKDFELMLDRTAPLPVASIDMGDVILDLPMKGEIVGSKIPLRLHSALDHFTDLHDQRFDSNGKTCAEKRLLPFQLASRYGPEATHCHQQAVERREYERSVLARAGMMCLGPKIFGGYKKIFNLHDTTSRIADAYGRTPVLAPIWGPDEGSASRTSHPQKKLKRTAPVMHNMHSPSGFLHEESILNSSGLVFVPASQVLGEEMLDQFQPVNGDHREIKEEVPDQVEDLLEMVEPKIEEPNDDWQGNGTSVPPALEFNETAPFVPPIRPDTANRGLQQGIVRARRVVPDIPSTSNGTSYDRSAVHAGVINVRQFRPAVKSPSQANYIPKFARRINPLVSHSGFPLTWIPSKRDPKWPPRQRETYSEMVRRLDNPNDPGDNADPADEGGVTWAPNLTEMERNQLRAGALAKTQNPHIEEGTSCFVCSVLRKFNEKPRTWQCNVCVSLGRALTPERDIPEEGPPPSKKPKLKAEESEVEKGKGNKKEEEIDKDKNGREKEVKEEAPSVEDEVSSKKPGSSLRPSLARRKSGRQRKTPAKYH